MNLAGFLGRQELPAESSVLTNNIMTLVIIIVIVEICLIALFTWLDR